MWQGMDLATICVTALVAVVAISCVTNANVGLLAMSCAWLLGAYVAPAFGYDFTAKTVAGWFPVDLFVTLTGVTLLFAIARTNGTLALVTEAAESLCRSRPPTLAPLFFLLATAVSAAGAGNVPTAAVLAAPAMLAASRSGVSPLVMMLMVGHGAIAGALSPLSPLGVVADENLAMMGLAGHEGYTFTMNLLVNAAVAALAYVLFSGWRYQIPASTQMPLTPAARSRAVAIGWQQRLTLGALACVILGAVFGGVHIGLASLAAATLLLFSAAAEERSALAAMPWGVILMVCGMSVLVALCEKTGALDLFSRWIAACSTPSTLPGWLAGLTGLVSVFSSTSGVVLPTFLPAVPDVLGHLDVDATSAHMLAAATAVNIGSNIVDVSSVSTIGALCVAAVQDAATRRQLYRQGLGWGLAMAAVGAAACQMIL